MVTQKRSSPKNSNFFGIPFIYCSKEWFYFSLNQISPFYRLESVLLRNRTAVHEANIVLLLQLLSAFFVYILFEEFIRMR